MAALTGDSRCIRAFLRNPMSFSHTPATPPLDTTTPPLDTEGL
jgi:hypothetical protein